MAEQLLSDAEALKLSMLERIDDVMCTHIHNDTLTEDLFRSYCKLRDEIVLFFKGYNALDRIHMLEGIALNEQVTRWILEDDL